MTLMLNAGMPVPLVAAWHGQHPAITLKVYSHAMPDALATTGDALEAALRSQV